LPCGYTSAQCSCEPEQSWPEWARPGAPAQDAPLGDDWLLNKTGNNFCLLFIGQSMPSNEAPPDGVVILEVAASDVVRQRYLGDETQAVYLLRPDQHIAARWTQYSRAGVVKAMATALANNQGNHHVTD
jgi:3-(3-hydroxy-phenyl)propionate hydroxylase